MVRAPCGSMADCVPLLLLRSERSCADAPCRIIVPVIVCVPAASNVSVRALATCLVKLLNVVDPVMDWLVPFRVTVPLPPEKLAPVLFQLPVRLILLEPADNVPLVSVRLPDTVMVAP